MADTHRSFGGQGPHEHLLPVLPAVLGWLAGTAAQLQLTELPGLAVTAAVGLGGGLIAVVAARRRSRWPRMAFIGV
jgi:hypothetical protein